ncbi:DUF4386 family protein [Nocardioides sp.]|uniref:DUF4386 family protein n=1 Tax=Nocardioides sp. TaxID=35761 RepID=UPI001A298F23|nr:DUF4386 family protein [Nocardioides sp.]MBJ7359851.1 DUF4386 family protein [Nocardioides sp.]
MTELDQHTRTTTTGDLSRWARGVVPAPHEEVRDRGPRFIAGAMVASPLAMTAWFLVEPAVLPREDAEVFLGSVAASPDRYLAATAMVALAGALGVAAAIGVVRLLRERLPRLAPFLGVVLVLSGLGLFAQVGFRLVTLSLVPDGSVPESAVASHAAFQSSGYFDLLLLPGLALGALGTVLLLGALLRTGVVSRWVPFALLAGAVLASGELPDPVTVGGAALGAFANLQLARALLSRG